MFEQQDSCFGPSREEGIPYLERLDQIRRGGEEPPAWEERVEVGEIDFGDGCFSDEQKYGWSITQMPWILGVVFAMACPFGMAFLNAAGDYAVRVVVGVLFGFGFLVGYLLKLVFTGRAFEAFWKVFLGSSVVIGCFYLYNQTFGPS